MHLTPLIIFRIYAHLSTIGDKLFTFEDKSDPFMATHNSVMNTALHISPQTRTKKESRYQLSFFTYRICLIRAESILHAKRFTASF